MSIKKYKKRPFVIEAIQLTTKNIKEVYEFVYGPNEVDVHNRMQLDKWGEYEDLVRENQGLKIETLEGTMVASFGDYVIKGTHGEFYPCKPEIFEANYVLPDNEKVMIKVASQVKGRILEYNDVVDIVGRDEYGNALALIPDENGSYIQRWLAKGQFAELAKIEDAKEKSIWYRFKELNEADTTNGTHNLAISPEFVSGNKVKQGAHITMGTEFISLMEIMDGKARPILLIINWDEFEKTK